LFGVKKTDFEDIGHIIKLIQVSSPLNKFVVVAPLAQMPFTFLYSLFEKV